MEFIKKPCLAKAVPRSISLLFSVILVVRSSGAEELAARVVSVHGEVISLFSATQRILKVGDVLKPKESVKTGAEGAIRLLLPDDSIIDLGANTEYIVEEFELPPDSSARKIESTLPYGRARASVNKKLSRKGVFKIKTPNYVIGVRGTEFLVDVPSSDADKANPSRVLVSEGVVQVATTAKSPTVLEAGTEARLRRDAGLDKVEINKFALDAAKKTLVDARVRDQSLLQRTLVRQGFRGGLDTISFAIQNATRDLNSKKRFRSGDFQNNRLFFNSDPERIIIPRVNVVIKVPSP